jgi:choline dehydrogenase-like flavoprotein
MNMDQHVYDVIVIGAGPVGQNVADRARAAGLRVAVVERELVGGECSYWTCVPSKALLHGAVADLQVFSGLGDADVPAAHWLRLRALADFSAIPCMWALPPRPTSSWTAEWSPRRSTGRTSLSCGARVWSETAEQWRFDD